MTQADFLRASFPAPVELPFAETAGPGRFFNRELSWLAFNWRVLEEAANPAVLLTVSAPEIPRPAFRAADPAIALSARRTSSE